MELVTEGEKTEDGRRKSEVGSQKTKDRRQKNVMIWDLILLMRSDLKKSN